MPSDPTSSDPKRSRRGLRPIAVVSAAAVLFAVLLILVRTRWGPMESVDHGLATDLNNLVSGNSVVVAILKRITWLGSSGVLVTAVLAGVIITAIRRRFRLTLYLIITCVGELVLDPVLKSLVGRVRPVVPDPISHGTGNSFPSGHSLGSIVCYGALLLVFLPAVPQRFRVLVRTLVAVLIAAIGISRIMLGVHYLSDVIGAWALGVAWLGLTAYAFELMRQETHRPVTQPLVEGLEPEAETDLEATADEPKSQRHPGRAAAALAIVWVLTLGVIVGIGELIMHSGNGNGNLLGDHTIPHWLAAHRTPSVTHWSAIFSTLGATQVNMIAILTTCVLGLAITRSWRPVVFILTLMAGELSLFLTTESIVKRPRPDVPNLENLPTHAYPSGHVAATLCVWVGISILVIGSARGWWRWLFLVPAIAMPILVATSRMYRGEHHPTDVLASILFAALWIPAVYALVQPLHRAPARTEPEPVEREKVPA